MLVFEPQSHGESDNIIRDLALSLSRLGVAKNFMRVSKTSSENMDIGSVLTIDLSGAYEIIIAAGNIAAFSHMIYESLGKYKANIKIKHEKVETANIDYQHSYEEIKNKLEKIINNSIDRPGKK